MILSRRSFLGGAATFTVTATLTDHTAAATTNGVGAAENLLPLYRAMRGGAGREAALWWLTGTLFAKVIGKTNVPLVQVHGASWNRIDVREDGNLDQAMDEAGYFGDVNTGAILDTWVNPINGHDAQPEGYRTVSRQIITPTAVEVANTPITVDGKMGPAIVSGDVVWVPEIFSATVPASLTGSVPRIVESMATFQARVDEVDLAAERFVPCTLFFQEVDPFYDWMGMQDEGPGLLVWQVVGRKLRAATEVPAFLATRLEADHPGFIEEPQV